jgi:lipoprotein-anchoring transpeptidase ErfK/SrfK
VIRLGKGGEKIIMANFNKIRIAGLNIALGGFATIAAVTGSFLANPAQAEPLALAAPTGGFSIFDRVLREPATPQRSVASGQISAQDGAELPAHLRRQVVDFRTTEAAGTVIIDTPNTYLYYVLGGGKAIRYGIGVGREGFTWSGVQTVARKAEWPDWIPPAEMLQRQPYLPRFMAGGPGNPLGARAMYLGGTIYRIHGTNQPSTIGGQVSSGCIRMVNDDVIDLYGRVNVGAKVVVLPAERGADAYRRARPGSALSVAANRTSIPSLH